jgi:hypothetical protein
MIPWELVLKQQGAYFRRNVVGALGPGFLLLIELLLLWAPAEAVKTPHQALAYFTQNTADLSVVAAVTLAIVAGFASYVLGRSCRSIIMWLAARYGNLFAFPLPTVRTWLLRGYGEDAVYPVIRLHPIWHVFRPDNEADRAGKPSGNPADPLQFPSIGFGEPMRDFILPYCKLWLRVNEPRLAVDYMESEAYILYTLIGPLVVGDALAIRWVLTAESRPFALLIWAIITLAVAISTLLLWRGANNRRKHEASDSLRNLLIAHWAWSTPPSKALDPDSLREPTRVHGDR